MIAGAPAPYDQARAGASDRGDSPRYRSASRDRSTRSATAARSPCSSIFYALPNGNTIEQTIGKAMQARRRLAFRHPAHRGPARVSPGEDHAIATWSSLTWKTISRAGLRGEKSTETPGFPSILDAVRDAIRPGEHPRSCSAGHSGGGSFIFGYLNTVSTAIPDDVERIAFLDANYAYETDRHQDKLAAWLNAIECPLPGRPRLQRRRRRS